ncbi:MAG: hypothetical protein KAW12_11565 [Candidatus Aminicenantes bacterium]|nr:hypothetical protein [Candidatus Aminicenantes bacterium]
MEAVLNLNRDELKKIIKEAVREVIEESKWDLFQEKLAHVSDREMKDIETHYAEPDKDVFYSEEIEI